VFGVEVAGNPPPKQADRSVSISGREGESSAARIFTGLPANDFVSIVMRSGRNGRKENANNTSKD
jgi:hypothetical protein